MSRLVAWLVPIARPRSFVGRGSQLAQLRAHMLAEGGRSLAIYGLGGCGKTSLALEATFLMKEHSPPRATFWVPAVDRASFEKAYYEIAKALCIPGIEDEQVDVKELVRARLDDDSFGSWLIVVDNADDTSVLFSKLEGANGLVDYLPRSRKGSIVFTTRTRAAATLLAEDNVIALGELDEVEATELLTRRLVHEHHYRLSEADVINNFLTILQFHALAIVQAIAFIIKNDVTIAEYVTIYRHSESDSMELLGEGFEDQTQHQETTNVVATTWYISFEQIQKHDAIAANHLYFMACTANNDIASSMFPPTYSKTQHVKAMGTLKAYAFITERRARVDNLGSEAEQEQKRFDVHPLVHIAIRGWLKAHDQWEFWINTTLARLIDIIPYGDHSYRDYWVLYLHHAVHLASLPEGNALPERMTLLERIGRCERSLGQFKAAERVYRQALEQRIKMCGREHPETLHARGNIALMLSYQDRWAEAEEMHMEEVAIATRVLGPTHPDTLTHREDQALFILGQHKFAQAEQLYRVILAQRIQIVGPTHLGTLSSMQNLACALCGQGKFTEAESLHREAFVLTQQRLGPQHADTISSLSALARTLCGQRKFSEATTLHREELTLRLKVLGENHPDTAQSMRNLANVLFRQRSYDEAESLQRRALKISEKVAGPERLCTLDCKAALADTIYRQGKWAESETIHREVLAVKERVLGKDHKDTLSSVFVMGDFAYGQEKYEEALELYGRALEGRKRLFGEEDYRTKQVRAMYDWAKMVIEEGKGVGEGAAGQKRIAPRAEGSEGIGLGGSELALRPRRKWRERLQQMVKKS